MTRRESPDTSHLKPELRLLLACGPVATAQTRQAVIHELLSDGIDWTRFAHMAVAHRLTSSVAHTLARIAPDNLPGDILDALLAIMDETARKSRALFDELGRLLEALATDGIEAIPLRGPVLAIQAYGGLGRRDFRKLELLVRSSEIAPTRATLSKLGYQRNERFDRAVRVPEHATLFGRTSGTPVEVRTRLTPRKMAFDIDYPALWHRARRLDLSGRTVLTFAPEDGLLLLALHGGTERWQNAKSACDLAAAVAAHPKLDWGFAVECARAQGCLRMLLVATALARKYLYAPISDPIVQAERSDRIIGSMIGRIVECWQSDESVVSSNNTPVSMDQLRLHDGIVRQVRHVARTVFLSTADRAVSMAAPADPRPASQPIRLALGTVRLALSPAHRRMRDVLERLPYAFAGSALILAVLPADPEIKRSVRRYQHARLEAGRALDRAPGDPVAWRDLGDALFGLRRYRKAITCYDKALSFVPGNAIIRKRRARALLAAGGPADLPKPPSDSCDATAWATYAERLFGSQRFAEAIEASDRALALDADNIVAARVGIPARLCACDWQRREADMRQVAAAIRAGRQIITPFWHRALSDSEADGLALAQLFGRGLMRPLRPLWRGERYRHPKIRVAYSSTDFRDHVVADVMAGCFEHHDKSRFHTTAIALGPDDGSVTRRRIAATFDRFVDVQAMNNLAIARLVRELEIDIVVDLNGYSGDRRTGIFAHRPAPVQAVFQGYPGTMGLPFYDYIIADPIVIPPGHRIHYSEQVVYLPHTYMPHDRTRPVAPRTPTRAEAGLPAAGFVFACHNNDYKFGPELFDIWMRLLSVVEGSVLWLKSPNPWARINLRREASARGVAPERIIFAPRLPRTEDHLARLRLADLFLDTRPYNAHATACDALWVGVPVVTCPGNTFPSRVAASLLHAVGLPELVAGSLAEYESLALALAQDPERLARIKATLRLHRDTEPLFDTARFTRDLEAAYTAMWTRQQDGLPPAGFTVDPMPACTE